jgi:hypothetical protein
MPDDGPDDRSENPKEPRDEASAQARVQPPPLVDEDIDDPQQWTCTAAVAITLVAVVVAFAISLLSGPADPLDTRVVQFQGDGALRTVRYPGLGSGVVSGPNGRDTDWAIFFYKPYCGACQRVWPAFRALGATTNSSGRLRFGEVNCVTDRGVCTMLGADKHPLVRIYRATSSTSSGPKPKAPASRSSGFTREPIAEWSGLLIAYELVDWFKSLQQSNEKIIHPSVVWPSPDDLGDAMRRFRARGKTQHDSSLSRRPDDPAGYLVDAELALTQGLVDHLFPHADAMLEGGRLTTLLRWLDLQSDAFPRASVRQRLKSLRTRLAHRPRWEREKYEGAVRAQNFSTDPPQDSEWRWCTPHNGRGGYSCGLWVLFHTTLANVQRAEAVSALQTIAFWVNDFFGCQECATHFMHHYQQERGAEVAGGHIGTVLWLWRAHNAVTKRLRQAEEAQDGSSTRSKTFPEHVDCEPCYNVSDSSSTVQVQEHSVFEYLQELYCFESDTYTCASFDDPSKATKQRRR